MIKAIIKGVTKAIVISKITDVVLDKVEQEGGVKAVLVKSKNEISELSGKCKQSFTDTTASCKASIQEFKDGVDKDISELNVIFNEEVSDAKKAGQTAANFVKTKTVANFDSLKQKIGNFKK